MHVFFKKILLRHVFISHAQGNSQDQCNAINEAFTKLGFKAWYDMLAANLTDDGMKDGVKRSSVFLLFLNRGTLSRPFVITEFQEAVKENKRIVLICEVDGRHDAPLDEHGNFDVSKIFGSETPADVKNFFTPEVTAKMIPYMRRRPFKEASLDEFIRQGGFEGQLQPASLPLPPLPPRTSAFIVHAPMATPQYLELLASLSERGVRVYRQDASSTLKDLLDGVQRSSFVVLFLTDHFFAYARDLAPGAAAAAAPAPWLHRGDVAALVRAALAKPGRPTVVVYETSVKKGAARW